MREQTRKTLGNMQIDQAILEEKSRDDIPQLLEGLKYIFLDENLRQQIFDILVNIFPKNINLHDGRPGMDLWSIFVIAVLRVNLNCDYDRIHNLVNHHKTIRQILGHGVLDDQESYCLQTLKDNVSLLTPEILDQIDQLVIKTGHEWIKKKWSTWVQRSHRLHRLMKNCADVVTLLWWKPTLNIQRIRDYYLMPCEKSSIC
jgi:hypothetical protein